MTFTTFPKPEPHFKQRAQRKKADEARKREVYRLVDTRDQFHCRACKRRCRQTMEAVPERWEHHHLRPRSLGGEHHIGSLIGLCLECHSEVTRHVLTITGNAQQILTFEKQGERWRG